MLILTGSSAMIVARNSLPPRSGMNRHNGALMQQTPSLFTRGKRVFARFKGLATVLVVAAISILFMGFAFTLRGGFLVYIPRSCFDSRYVHSSISSLVIKRFFTVLTGQADITMILYDNVAATD